MERNYWMFRVSNKWGNKTEYCLKNNLVYCGWNYGLSKYNPETILKNHPEASKMAIKFNYINPNDIIIMPVSGGIAIAEAKEKEYREDLDWKDTIKVKWLTEWYPRNNLNSNFQSSLKYRGTFLNLNKYKNDIDTIIENNFDSLDQQFQKYKNSSFEANIIKIATHLNSRKNLNFQDREFENFILHLMELNYSGLKGQTNNQKQEALDGKDLTMSIDFDDFNLNILLNVQVKQHEGKANSHSLFQISKSDNTNPYVKNVVVTTGELSNDLLKKAEEMEVILFGPQEIATMILDNFDQIDPKFQAKLNLVNTIESPKTKNI